MAIKIITEWHEGFPEPYPFARVFYNNAISILRGSSLAMEMIHKLEANPQFVINIIPTHPDEGVNMFMDEELNTSQTLSGSVITWDPAASNQTENGLQGPEIGLIHEMGHALQYMENRGWYMAYTRMYLEAKRQNPNGKSHPAQKVVEKDVLIAYEKKVARQLGQGWREKYD
jgi:hypothetical protein